MPVATHTTITARELRRLAEFADGYRGKNLSLVANKDGHAELMLEDDSRLQGAEVLCSVVTEPLVRDWPTPKITCKPPSGEEEDISATYDCIAWSESAIEKFFLTYYLSMRILTDEQVTELRTAYKKGHIVAYVHKPWTWYGAIVDPLRQVQVLTKPKETMPFAKKVTPVWHDLRDFLKRA